MARLLVRSVLFLLMCRASAAFAQAASEPASKPAAFTNHDHVQSLHDYNRRTLSEAYRQIGQRDPKWDDDAYRFFDGMAIRFTNATMSLMYHLPGEPDSPELLRWAKAARDRGCDDPMLTYCYATVLNDAGRAAEARPLVGSASKAVMTSRYPVNRAANAARRFAYLAADQADRDAAWEQFNDCVLAELTTWQFQGIDRRILFDQIMPLNEMPVERQKELIDEINQHPNADPWLAHMIEGQYHFLRSWEARGRGFANTVTRERWKLFHDGQGRAREHFLTAHKLRPDYPEAAAAMISVAKSGEFKDDARQWFDRAIAAQFDMQLAYDAYLDTLLPRWGGSTQAMIQFAQQCLDTARFDTSVPFQYATVIEKIAWDHRDPQIWTRPGVYDNVARLCQGYVQRGVLVDSFRSYQAAVASRARRFADARQLLDEAGDKIDEYSFYRMRAIPKLAISHVYAMAGDAAAGVEAAEAEVAAGHLDAGIDAYQKLAAAAKDKSAFFLNSRLRQLQWQKQFETGEWVALQPSDPDLTGWGITFGKVERNPDGAVHIRNNRPEPGEIAFQGQFFGSRYEIEATIELPDTDSASAGITTARNDPLGLSGHHGISVAHGPGERSFIDDTWNNMQHPIPRTKITVLRMQVWDDSVFAFVNDKKSLRKPDMNGWMMGPIYLGLIGRTDPPETGVKFTNIRMRQLKEHPEGKP